MPVVKGFAVHYQNCTHMTLRASGTPIKLLCHTQACNMLVNKTAKSCFGGGTCQLLTSVTNISDTWVSTVHVCFYLCILYTKLVKKLNIAQVHSPSSTTLPSQSAKLSGHHNRLQLFIEFCCFLFFFSYICSWKELATTLKYLFLSYCLGEVCWNSKSVQSPDSFFVATPKVTRGSK